MSFNLRGRRTTLRVSGGNASFKLNRVVNVNVEQIGKSLEFGKRQVLQINAVLNAMMDELARDFVSLAEGQIFF